MPSPPAPSNVPPPGAAPLRAAERRWWDAVRAASPVELPPAVWQTIAAAYTTPGRHYHTLEHLEELSRRWQEVARGPGWQDPRATWLALLFHDAVYEVGSIQTGGAPGSNEARSAALLRAHVPDAGAAEAIILLTAAHGFPLEGSLDALHFLDADMAILAAPPGRFARYERQIAAEYAPVVGAEAYRAGRRAFLEHLLASPRIFRSEWFHARLDARARANLRRALG